MARSSCGTWPADACSRHWRGIRIGCFLWRQCVRVMQGYAVSLYDLDWSPDGSRLASCGDDGAIMLWDLQGGEHLRTLRRDRPYERLNITGIQGLTEAQKATLRALGAVENRS